MTSTPREIRTLTKQGLSLIRIPFRHGSMCGPTGTRTQNCTDFETAVYPISTIEPYVPLTGIEPALP